MVSTMTGLYNSFLNTDNIHIFQMLGAYNVHIVKHESHARYTTSCQKVFNQLMCILPSRSIAFTFTSELIGFCF